MRTRHLMAVTAGCLILALGGQAAQQANQSIVPDRVVVVFRNTSLPDDARERVQAAGGIMTDRLDEVGILVASPGSADADTLIRNLRRDSAVLDADYDRVLDLIAPLSVGADAPDAGLSPTTHLAHPLPTFSPLLPADFFYTSSPQQWAVKRVGAQGGGIPGGGSGAWDSTFGAGARIAILDTGVTPEHPDLSPNLVLNLALTFDIPGAFGTPNCEVPDPSNAPFDLPQDQLGHGTFTSSLAGAAAGAGTGLLIGVAPEAEILNIKVVRTRPATPAELATLGVADTPVQSMPLSRRRCAGLMGPAGHAHRKRTRRGRHFHVARRALSA